VRLVVRLIPQLDRLDHAASSPGIYLPARCGRAARTWMSRVTPAVCALA
jgi:hypothetical protein